MTTAIATAPRSRSYTVRSTALLSLVLALVAGLCPPTHGASWRVGDSDQPWCLYPVSVLLDEGFAHRPEYIWGGSYSVEIVVDEDGDGLIDEDPVDIVDDDGDYLYNEDGADLFDNDADGLIDEDPVNGIDDDGDGSIDEDPVDFIDNDRDGLVNEDGPDPQFDNDGDGLLNEDGPRTGGVIYDPTLRGTYESEPFFRHPDAESAAADPGGQGFGWGDDDRDTRTNEDPLDGRDNDGDGLVDEDPAGPPGALPRTLSVPTFGYDTAGLTDGERRALAFAWDEEQLVYVAEGPGGDTITASVSRVPLTPSDWLRPIRLDSRRNMVTLAADRFLSGIYSGTDPMTGSYWGALPSHAGGATHAGTSGFGQVADGSIFTARSTAQASYTRGFGVHFLSLFYLELVRLRPRPDFPDRTPTSFDIYYAGDKETHFRTTVGAGGGLNTRMTVLDPAIPRQTDQRRPAIKEYRFEEGGEWGPPPKVRILNFWGAMPEGQTWELAEFEAYGEGYPLDASYVTEIIDVGPARPRFRRHRDNEDPINPNRPILLETIKTVDLNRNGEVEPEERADVKAAAQFDSDLGGLPVTWGRLRWHGQAEGSDGDVLVRVRTGTSLDTRIYQRKVGRGVTSPYVERPIVGNWPQPGERIDVHVWAQLSGLEREHARELPPNALGSQDGLVGGWTPWSAPFHYIEGLVEQDGSGGILLPMPPLHRYIQFRLDFLSEGTGGVSLDYLEFDFSSPVVTRGVLAEIFPDTTTQLGVPSSFRYVLKPDMASDDAGFNRIDIVVPSTAARVDSLLVDDLVWEHLHPPTSDPQEGRAWLDTLTLTQPYRFASTTYYDSADGVTRLAIKTPLLTATDFPRGLDREMEILLNAPVFRLLTRFHSWVWNDAVDLAMQPTEPGNASDKLPTDQVEVTVLTRQETLNLHTVTPNPFTPNDDGINEVVTFDFDIFLLTSEAEISICIYSLDGQPLRKLEQSGLAGTGRLEWDGRDETKHLVPPGIYLYRLYVDSDTKESKERTGTIALTY